MEEKKEDGFVSLGEKNPELVSQWDAQANGNRTPWNTPHASHYKAFWNCPSCKRQYQAAVYCRTARGSGCPYCAGRLAVPGVTSLEARYPDLAGEWDHLRNGSLSPDDVLPGSSQKQKWHCTDGHVWAVGVSPV